MVKEEDKKKRMNYIAAISLALLIFLLGSIAGWQYSDYKLQKFQSEQEKLNLLISGLDIKGSLLSSQGCNINLTSLFDSKKEIGGDVAILESRLGKENEDVLLKKEQYQLVEIKTLLLFQKLNKDCNYGYDTIVFFYTNSKQDNLESAQSEDQGYILDNLYLRNKDSLVIFSFDINTNNPAINSLKDIYGVKKAPTLIINEVVYPGFKSSREIESKFNN
jgi:hypothetical protein